MKQLHRFLCILGLAAAAVILPASASLASIGLEIDVVGLNFKYDASQDGSLFDAPSKESTSIDGGHGLTGEATQVTLINFYLGGVLKGSLLSETGSELYADFLICGIYDIPSAPPRGGWSTVTSSTGQQFGFDLMDSSGKRFLSLELGAVNVTYKSTGLQFRAQGPSLAVVSQDLPFGLVIDAEQPITVRVSSTTITTSVDKTTGNLTGFWAQGGMATVGGMQVPEPASFAALLAIGVMGLEICSWKKRRRIQRSARVELPSSDN